MLYRLSLELRRKEGYSNLKHFSSLPAVDAWSPIKLPETVVSFLLIQKVLEHGFSIPSDLGMSIACRPTSTTAQRLSVRSDCSYQAGKT